MSRRIQFNLSALLLLTALAAFAVQMAMLGWFVYRELVVQLAQAALIFSVFGLLWFVPFLPAIFKRRRRR